MSESKWHVNYQREEVRSIFVLGVIATLLTLRQSPEIIANNDFILNIVNWLAIFWGCYIFLMAVAVSSEDWINESVAKRCHVAAQFLFVLGIAVTPSVIIVSALNYVGSYLNLLHNPLYTIVLIVLPFATGFGFGTILAPRRKHKTGKITEATTKEQTKK